MISYRLPVSGEEVLLSELDGQDEIRLAHPSATSIAFQLEMLSRLASPCKAELRWEELPIADFNPAFLAIRRRFFGDRLVAEVRCPACEGKGDITFSVSEYLAAHRPTKLRQVTMLPGGWYQCSEARFRLATISDWLVAMEEQRTETEIASALEKCSIEADSPAGRRRARRALEKMAPSLVGMVVGACPDCRASIDAWFDPAAYIMAELGRHAASIFGDVHLIAEHYQWTEDIILKLPAWRRAHYAALIAASAGTARATAY